MNGQKQMNIKGIINSDILIEGERVFLRKFRKEDITENYIRWLNDPEVNQYLSIRYSRQDYNSVEEYVKSFSVDNHKLLLGIFFKEKNKHIGNITLNPIDLLNNFAAIGISLGEKQFWGKGFARESVLLAIDFAFYTLNIHKLEAGVCVDNVKSKKLFEGIGFTLEGVIKDREWFKTKYCDKLVFGLLNNRGHDDKKK